MSEDDVQHKGNSVHALHLCYSDNSFHLNYPCCIPDSLTWVDYRHLTLPFWTTRTETFHTLTDSGTRKSLEMEYGTTKHLFWIDLCLKILYLTVYTRKTMPEINIYFQAGRRKGHANDISTDNELTTYHNSIYC